MTLDELIEPLTVDEVKQAIYDTLDLAGASTTSWKPGAVVRTIIAGLAIVLAAMSRLQAAIAKSGFLDLAEGDWLTNVALYVYGVERDDGTFATGTVRLSNGAGGVYSGGAGDLIVQNPSSKATYRSTGAWAIAAGPGSTADVAVEAVELGSGSTSTPTMITAFVTPLSGVTVTNLAALVGGDAESDPDLRERCREKLGTLSPNGPRDAYAFLAKTATKTDGTQVNVTRVKSTADGLGGVGVVLASPTGPVTGAVGDLTTDLGAANDVIQRMCTPLGVTATVTSATAKTINVTYELWVLNTTGMTDAQIQAAVALALTNFHASLPVGGEVISPATGKVYKTALQTVIGAAVGVSYVVRVDVTVPAGDTDVTTTEAPVFGIPTVTAIHQVAP